jgi:hypothetical protein
MRMLPIFRDRLLRATLVLSLGAFVLAQTGAANTSSFQARVITPGAAVHSGPGESFYPTDTLPEGEVVEVYREQPGGWLGIRPPEGSFSWLFGLHVTPLDGTLAEVDKEDVASRIGSRLGDQRNAVQVRLKKGEVVEVIGEETVDSKKWYKIAPPAGEFRWIHARNLERIGGRSAAEPTTPPVVTVPVPGGNPAQAKSEVTLVADSQQQADESWRAAPPEPANKANESDAAALPADANAPVEPASEPQPAAINPSEASTSATAESTGGVPSVAAAPNAAAAAAPAPMKQAETPVANDLHRQLTDIELRLSRIVAELPTTWQIEPLKTDAEQLLAQSATAAERAAVNSTLAKLDRFAAIARRYQQQGIISPSPPLPVSPSGYDAIGILRPVVSKRPGAPQFALVDDRGQVVSFVTPTPDVNLQPYLGHRIGITGSRGFIPEFQRAHVTAGRVSPLSERLVR